MATLVEVPAHPPQVLHCAHCECRIETEIDVAYEIQLTPPVFEPGYYCVDCTDFIVKGY